MGNTINGNNNNNTSFKFGSGLPGVDKDSNGKPIPAIDPFMGSSGGGLPGVDLDSNGNPIPAIDPFPTSFDAEPVDGGAEVQHTSLHPATFDELIRARGTEYFKELNESREGTPIAFSDIPGELDLEKGIDITPDGMERVKDSTAYVQWGHVYVRTIADGGFGGTHWTDLGSVQP